MEEIRKWEVYIKTGFLPRFYGCRCEIFEGAEDYGSPVEISLYQPGFAPVERRVPDAPTESIPEAVLQLNTINIVQVVIRVFFDDTRVQGIQLVTAPKYPRLSRLKGMTDQSPVNPILSMLHIESGMKLMLTRFDGPSIFATPVT